MEGNVDDAIQEAVEEAAETPADAAHSGEHVLLAAQEEAGQIKEEAWKASIQTTLEANHRQLMESQAETNRLLRESLSTQTNPPPPVSETESEISEILEELEEGAAETEETSEEPVQVILDEPASQEQPKRKRSHLGRLLNRKAKA